MDYRFEFKFYRRQFCQELVTGHGGWNIREGLLVRLEDESNVIGYGEIAPMPLFGSESIDEAGDYCRHLNGRINDSSIDSMDYNLPACRFALESARDTIQRGIGNSEKREVRVAALLPHGENGLKNLKKYSERGFTTYKWKMGVNELEDEQSVFARIVKALPDNARIRLDANGALTVRQAEDWLKILDDHDIEFLEQPLPPSEMNSMYELTRKYRTPIALDESVATFENLKNTVDRGWPGLLIVKPSIMGSLTAWYTWRSQSHTPVIFSSVFETAIGFQAGLKLAAACEMQDYAAGYGTNSYFLDDGFSLHGDGPILNADLCTLEDFEKIWRLIGKN